MRMLDQRDRNTIEELWTINNQERTHNKRFNAADDSITPNDKVNNFCLIFLGY